MTKANEYPSKTRSALAGKHVLITGTTGFVGKVLLEKIMRDVPEIGGVHLLIRPSQKYPQATDRFTHEIASSSIFDLLKQESPAYFEDFCHNRVHCVAGEVTEPLFGLTEEEFKDLASRVDVIINSAASVNFREELDQALLINTLSLNQIMSLARAAGDIPVVQVSTCYVNGYNQGDMREENVVPAGRAIPRHSTQGYFLVEEVIARLRRKISRLRQKYPADSKELKQKLIELGIEESNRYGWNDTYTFTKWMGEQLLMKGLAGKTLTILRPSIVESTLKSPVPGWIEGVKVADAIILAYAREKVTFFPAKTSGVIDVIPADLVANGILLSAAEALLQPGQHRIYQCCSSGTQPIKLGDFISHIQQEALENWNKYDRLFYRRPQRPFIPVDRTLFNAVMGAARLPLRGLNMARDLLGLKDPMPLLDNFETAMNLATIFSFYTAPSYIFHNTKLMALAERMGETDRELFPVDARAINWKQYLREIHLAGLQKYALKPRKVYQLDANSRRKQRAA